MKYLHKTWIRIVVSLLAGGFVSEIIHINTGDPNRPAADGESFLVLIVAVVTFYFLTILVNRQQR